MPQHPHLQGMFTGRKITLREHDFLGRFILFGSHPASYYLFRLVIELYREFPMIGSGGYRNLDSRAGKLECDFLARFTSLVDTSFPSRIVLN